MNDANTGNNQDSISHSHCGCELSGVEVVAGKFRAAVLDSCSCAVHLYNQEDETQSRFAEVEVG